MQRSYFPSVTTSIMFGDAGSQTRADTPSSASIAPRFPLYLLPTSLTPPFARRRRQTSESAPDAHANTHTHARSYSTDTAGSVRSLSSSPASYTSTATSFLPGSPSSPISSTFSADALSPCSPNSKSSKPRHSRDPAEPQQPSITARVAGLSRTHPDILRCSTCSTEIAFSSQIVSKGFTGRHGRAFLVSPPSLLSSPSCPGTFALSSSSVDDAEDGNLINIRVGRPENRQLVTGAHVVADISCVVCGVKLGWKYVDARETSQKYKVGKFILETVRVVPCRSWADVHVTSSSSTNGGGEDEEDGFGRGGVPGWARLLPQWLSESPRRTNLKKGGGYNINTEGYDFYGTDEGMMEGLGTEEDEVEAEGPVVFDSDDDEECEDIFAGAWDAEVVRQRRRTRSSGGRKGMASG